MTVATDTRLGSDFAGYSVEEVIGRGGMSVVYRAEHVRLRRKAALKVLSPELAGDERFRERFLRESELAASLDHPNIVPVYDAGEVDGLLYIAMRYVDGTDLKAVLRRDRPLEAGRTLRLAGQIADALDAAHERGLVHRDVKPSNVLVASQGGKEHCYLADFGLTKSASDAGGFGDMGQMVGTIDYVAPEQIRGDVVDGRADVYSLACLLYECLAGDVPFRRPNEMAVIFAHLEETAPRASERRAELPPAVDEVLAKGLAKLPSDRYETAGELVDAARAAFPGERALVRGRFAGRRRRTLLIGAAAAVAAVAAALGALLPGGGMSLAQAAVVRIDPVDSTVSPTAKLGGVPTAVVVCAGSVWVTSRDGIVSEIEPRSSTIARITVRGTPEDVADVGNLAAVVTRPPRGGVTMIDAQFGQVSNFVPLTRGALRPATATAYGPTVWIADPSTHALERLQSPYTYLARAVELPGYGDFEGVAAGQGAIWVVGSRTLWRVNAATGRLVATIPLDFEATDVAAAAGAVWLVDEEGGAVVRLDPESQRLVARIRTGDGPRAVAADSHTVWVANSGAGTVSRIDPRRNAVVRTVGVGPRPVDIAVGLGSVWVVREPQ